MLRQAMYSISRSRVEENDAFREFELRGMKRASQLVEEHSCVESFPTPIVEILQGYGCKVTPTCENRTFNLLAHLNPLHEEIEVFFGTEIALERWALARCLCTLLFYKEEGKEGLWEIPSEASCTIFFHPLGFYKSRWDAESQAFAAMLLLPTRIWHKVRRWQEKKWNKEALISVDIGDYRETLYERYGF